jgi:hypothetical protein
MSNIKNVKKRQKTSKNVKKRQKTSKNVKNFKKRHNVDILTPFYITYPAWQPTAGIRRLAT